LGESARKPAASRPGGDVFQRVGRTSEVRQNLCKFR
jgi:hypothetical protein